MVIVKSGNPEDGNMQYTSFPPQVAVAPYMAPEPATEQNWYADVAIEPSQFARPNVEAVYVGVYQLVSIRKLVCEVHDSPAQ